MFFLSSDQLVFGFGQADYSDFESNSVTVEVIKRDANIGDFVVTISPLTYSLFENQGVPLPSELPEDMRPNDPAECKCKTIEMTILYKGVYIIISKYLL